MQIQKMLNVLILIFLVINVGLFFYLRQAEESEYTLTNARIEQVKNILEDRGIILSTDIPTAFYPMARLIIEQPEHLEKELETRFFGDEASVRYSDGENRVTGPSDNGGILKFLTGDEDGRIIYINETPVYTVGDFGSIIELRNTANGFVKDLTLDSGDYEITDERLNEEKSFYFFYFNESYEDALLFCNEVRLKMEEKGITEATSIRYIPRFFDEEAMEIYPADHMLYEFMGYLGDEGMTDVEIRDIDLGYHLGPDGLGNQLTAEIEPYYRVRIGTGQTFYINAYTNDISNY